MLFAALAALPSHAAASEIAKGDVNGDGKVDMKDVALLRDVVLGVQSASLSLNVTDINGDGSLTVTDVTTLVKYLRERQEGGIDVDIDGWDDAENDHGGIAKSPVIRRSVTTVGPKTWEVTISLSSEVEINGFQLSLSVPDSLELVEYSSGAYGMLASRKAESHRLYNGKQSTVGELMFMSYSDKNDLFAGTSGDIMKFKFMAIGDGVPSNCDVTVSSIEMSDKECKAIRSSDFVLSGASIVENERAYAALSSLLSDVQAKLDKAQDTIAGECTDVAASYDAWSNEIQATIDSLSADLKSKYESIDLTEEDKLELSDIEASIEKMVTDAMAAQELAGLEDVVMPQRQAKVDVYSVNGTKIGAQLPMGKASEGLRKGVYIINKKKVLVR